MLWAVMIIAMITAVAVEVACFFAKIKNFPLVLALQFFITTGVAYGIAYRFAGTNYGMQNILISCAAVSLVIVVLNAILHHYLGSWYDRRPGPGMK